MENEILTKIAEQNAKIDAIYVSVEKTRKYFQMIFWITIVTIVLPLLAMVFIIPMVISSYSTALSEIGGL